MWLGRYDTNSWCNPIILIMGWSTTTIEFYITNMVGFVSVSCKLVQSTLYIVSNAIGFALNSLLLSLIAF